MDAHFTTTKSIKVRSQLLLVLFILFFLSHKVAGQEEGIYNVNSNTRLSDQRLPSLSLFEDRSKLKVEILTNQEKLLNSLENEDKQKATLTMYLNDSIKIVKKIKVKVRGNTRKKICDLPPLKVDFGRSDFLSDWLGNVTSVKIVNTCADGADFDGYLHKEYLMYDIYNKITDVSYRVRIVELTIKDSKKLKGDITGYAFFIENDKSLARRTQLVETEEDETNVAELMKNFYMNPTQETLFNTSVLSIFQYMTGNADWNISGMHNIKIFGNQNTYYPVPYDFDYSGFVNAQYAKPSPSLQLKDIRERFYQGPCCDPVTFEKALDYVISKKDLIIKMVEYYPYLPGWEKKDLKRYLGNFFKEAANRPVFTQNLSTINCQN